MFGFSARIYTPYLTIPEAVSLDEYFSSYSNTTGKKKTLTKYTRSPDVSPNYGTLTPGAVSASSCSYTSRPI